MISDFYLFDGRASNSNLLIRVFYDAFLEDFLGKIKRFRSACMTDDSKDFNKSATQGFRAELLPISF